MYLTTNEFYIYIKVTSEAYKRRNGTTELVASSLQWHTLYTRYKITPIFRVDQCEFQYPHGSKQSMQVKTFRDIYHKARLIIILNAVLTMSYYLMMMIYYTSLA